MIDQAHIRALTDILGDKGIVEEPGAMVAYPLLCSALAFMNQMASFESAGVSQRIR